MTITHKFNDGQLRDLYAISLATGHMGGDASHLYADPDLIGHIYSAPYAALEPSRILLLVDDEGVAGFVLGTFDTISWESRLEQEWWPILRSRYPDPSNRPATEWTPDQRRAYMIHHPTHVPSDVCGSYPAHLHLNLLPRVQGIGAGKRLLHAWLQLATEHGVRAVHVGVNRYNNRAIRFWSHSGFDELHLGGDDQGRTVWMGNALIQNL